MDEMVDRLLDILADKLTERLSAGHKELYTAKELAERYGVSYELHRHCNQRLNGG